MSSLRELPKPGDHVSVDASAAGIDLVIAAVAGRSIVICDVTIQGSSDGHRSTESDGSGVICYLAENAGHHTYTAPIRVESGKPVYSNIEAKHTITYYLI